MATSTCYTSAHLRKQSSGDADVHAGKSSLPLSLLPAPLAFSCGRALTCVHGCVRYRLHIVGESMSEIHNCLLALPGTRREDVRRIISDADALSHCDAFIRGLPGVVRQAVDDTAQAAKTIAENGWRSGSPQAPVWLSQPCCAASSLLPCLSHCSTASMKAAVLSENNGMMVYVFGAGMLQPSGAREQQSCTAWK